MRTPLNRREFFANASAATGMLSAGDLFGRLPPPPSSNKKLAAIVTTYHRYSHADDIVTKIIEGYSIVGKSYPPPFRVASLFIDQTPDTDIGRPLAKHWDVPVVKTISESLTLGGDKLAVDGVLLVAEQGEYPLNERGQKLYPRRKFFEEVVKVFRASKRSVPVYVDKHFSYSWEDAKWMYDQSKELGFPMMAGSSVPVAKRIPDLQPKIGVEWERVLSVGHGHFEVYGFHTLEALQVMTERRKGGETGVRTVQCLAGKDAWDAAKTGKWDRKLLDDALAVVPNKLKGTVDEVDKDVLVYLIEYRDGFQAAAYMSPRYNREFAFGGQIKGQKDPVAFYFELPKPQRDHFSFLVQHISKMMVTGKSTYPVERTLLTTGMLAALMESKADGNKRIETPHLKVEYHPVELS
ncbi:MAG: hypothetical protein K8T89_13440 [Planctomycetes bacterium]|nr:hypothetical protein [Planctomycetota bacterium]